MRPFVLTELSQPDFYQIIPKFPSRLEAKDWLLNFVISVLLRKLRLALLEMTGVVWETRDISYKQDRKAPLNNLNFVLSIPFRTVVLQSLEYVIALPEV